VLVVDDDASTRLMVREVLAPAGFEVEEADGGRQGLLLVDSFRPDVVLLDILMPGMDGFETLKSMRDLEHGADCPVVMITGLQDPGAVESAYEHGAADFVTKPINWGLLRHRLMYVLRSSMGPRESEPSTSGECGLPPGVGKKDLKRRLREFQSSARRTERLIRDLIELLPDESGGETR
jgi:PleD family two-component response regulator